MVRYQASFSGSVCTCVVACDIAAFHLVQIPGPAGLGRWRDLRRDFDHLGPGWVEFNAGTCGARLAAGRRLTLTDASPPGLKTRAPCPPRDSGAGGPDQLSR